MSQYSSDCVLLCISYFFFFQEEEAIRVAEAFGGLGNVNKGQFLDLRTIPG